MKSKARFLAAAFLILAGLSAAPTPVSASVPKDAAPRPDISVAWDLATGGCACAKERATVAAYRDRILAAPTPEAARELALSQTRLAKKALSRARWVLPFSGTIGETRHKLEAYEARVLAAKSQADVAAQFGRLVRLAEAKPGTVVDALELGGTTCSYTTTEIVIILIGFLLAIIPGIIFLFLLC
jgi:hypothetical protein